VRAINVPAIFAIFAFFSVWFYDEASYLVPCGDLYECFALVALFYYIISVVAPDAGSRNAFFDQLELHEHGETVPGGSLKWFQVGVVQPVENTTANTFRKNGLQSSKLSLVAS
jgi:hypothetical protein